MSESTKVKLDKLKERKKKAAEGGGEARLEAQRNRGKLTARERIDLLVKRGSFVELDRLAATRSGEFTAKEGSSLEGDAVVTGFGEIDGRTIYVYSQDFTVLGGSLSLVAGQKIAKLMDHAYRTGSPIVGINDSGGARIQEGVDALAGYGEIFLRNTRMSGVVPQITVIAGPAAGGAVYSPAMTDFIFMTRNIGQMYVTGPGVVKAVTGEETSHEELGGAKVHAETSGVAHFIADSEPQCFAMVRKLLSFLPSNNAEQPEIFEAQDDPNRIDAGLRSLIPDQSIQPYDIMNAIASIADDRDFLPVQSDFAENIVVGFARLGGRSAGIVANQPKVKAGMLDIDASDKAARFVRFCDSFNVPLITLVDVPGFMPGVVQEHEGIIRHGAKLIYAYADATVPKLTVILRKAYGGAYIVMSSKHLNGDLNLAWPTAEIAVMGPEGAAGIIGRREIDSSENPAKKKKELAERYRESFANPYIAANRGYIDDVIDPAETRSILIKALRAFSSKTEAFPYRKHGNIPL